MNKPIFSITCTTCQTRLAVRTEAAIGLILECPKCQNMVQVVPPEGWRSSQPPAEPPPPEGHPGPPPLNRVADGPLVLELEPTETTFLHVLLRSKWMLGGIALLLFLIVVVVLYWLSSTPPKLETAESDKETEQPTAVAVQEPKPSTTTVKNKTEPATKTVEKKPEPEKKPVPPTTAADKKPETEKQPDQPETTPLPTLPTSPEAKPAESEPVPSNAEKENGKEKENAPPEVKKLPPEQVDIAARLADPLPGIELTNMPLADAVELMATMSTMPITLDPDAMRQIGLTARDPISLRLDATTVGQALQEAVAKLGLAVVADGGNVLITTPADYRETLKKIPYTVSDLTGNDKAAAAELAAIIRKLVAPESWKGNSGQGTIEPDNGNFTIEQTGAVHQQVLVFCEKLRNARHMQLRSSHDAERFTLTTRLDQARKTLDRPVTVNYHEPATLADVLAFLAKAAKCDILVDHAALAAAETSDRVDATLTVDKKPLGTSLEDLLRPLGLTYRVVGPSTIQVTTKETAEEKLELEFYPIRPLLDKKNSPLPLGEGSGVRAAKLIELLKSKVAPTTWIDSGGPCEINFDPPSRCLIVLQSQPAQAAIEKLLEGNGEGESEK